MKQLIPSILLFSAFTVANAQTVKTPAAKPISKTSISKTAPKLVETVSKVGNEIVIPYKKFMLSNGLTIGCIKTLILFFRFQKILKWMSIHYSRAQFKNQR